MCDLESALNPQNYDDVLLPQSKPKMYTAIIEKAPNKKISDEYISWTNQKPQSAGRQPRSAVIIGQPGPTGVAKHATDAKSSWELFFLQKILEIVVKCTNQRIEKAKQNLNLSSKTWYNFMDVVDETEILAFIGLMYLRGLALMCNHDVKYLYSALMDPQPFGATMSKNRFQFLYACISFDDLSTRQARWKHDRFAAIRELFEIFGENCCKHVIPDKYLSLDETLYPMRTSIGFKQFNPSKPAKYGLLFKSINAVRYSYTFSTTPYCGKSRDQPTAYYTQGTENVAKYLVMQLQKHVDIQGRNISFDRLYTSISLAKWLLSNNITCVGTLQANRKGIPMELKSTSGSQLLSYECFWENENKKLVLHSYVVKTNSTGLRNVLFLSSMQPLLGTTKDDGKKKPAIYKLYDFTKGGTDVMDQRMATFNCKTKSNRWTIAAFVYMLDICRVNAATVLAMNRGSNPRKVNSYDFGMDLALRLIRPHVQQRSLTGLQISIGYKIDLLLNYGVFSS